MPLKLDRMDRRPGGEGATSRTPHNLLDVWNDDIDAHLASWEDLAAGGHGVWYNQSDDGEVTGAVQDQASKLLAEHDEKAREAITDARADYEEEEDGTDHET